MNCVADTHAAIWYLLASPELSLDAKNFINSVAASGGLIFVPAISIIEIIYLTEKGRLPASTLPRMIEAVNLPESGFSFRAIDAELAQSLREIPRTIVPDMPDRIIAATALHLNLPLVTKDLDIRLLQSVQTIW
jgi:PIN domain nuclease of toxin-antitoxin system